MSRITERTVLIISDLIGVNLAYVMVYVLKFHTGLMETGIPPTLLGGILGGVVLSGCWLLILLFFGLYRSKFAVSRTDEILMIFKAVTLGAVILFILTIDFENPLTSSRINIFNYWMLLIFFLSIGRIIIRTYQRNRLKKGHGRRKTLIIGAGKKAQEVYDQILSHPVTGFDVQGFLNTSPEASSGIKSGKILGDIDNYNEVCNKYKIEEVLIILDRPSKKKLFEIVDKCDGFPAALKTIPDIYEIAVGSAHIQHLYGLQLVDILPENYSPGFMIVKRIIDISISSFIIFFFLPFWVITGIAIIINSKGSVFYRQKRVGQHGEIFTIYKFRSMVHDADQISGHLLTQDRDPRITAVGRIIRRLRIDEVPQLINVLEGEMSLIGPRPELQYYVQRYVKEIPLYSKRLRAKPGITGLAQVKQKFSDSVTDIKTKMEYDLFYIENMSLKLDLKIFLATIFTIITRSGG